VADASRLARLGQLESDEPAVVADDRIGGLVARIVTEMRETLVSAA
jgi:hypothetical protein